MFLSILKRCGRYLTELILIYGHMLDEELVNMITKYCPQIQYIDLKDYYTFNKADIETVKPIFNLFRTFNCSLRGMSNKESKKLFSLNKKLECLEINCNEALNGSFLFSLSRETMKELVLTTSQSIPFDRICHVSIETFYESNI